MRTVVLAVEAQKSMVAHTESRNHCCTASSICRAPAVVVVGGAVQIAVVGFVESSIGCHIEFVEYCRCSVEAIRSLLYFHKTAFALSPMVFVVGKPLDCMVDGRKSCCLIAKRLDYTAEQLVAGIVIVCEQIAAGCMWEASAGQEAADIAHHSLLAAVRIAVYLANRLAAGTKVHS